jgi:hypothetical protein
LLRVSISEMISAVGLSTKAKGVAAVAAMAAGLAAAVAAVAAVLAAVAAVGLKPVARK